MKFNYQQMVNTFGKIYAYENYEESAIVEENFNLFFKFNKEDTIEKAIEQLKAQIEAERIEKIKRLEGMKTEFNNLPFFEKLQWQIKNKKINFDSTSEDRKKIVNEKSKFKLDNIEIKLIDKNIDYTVKTPYIVKEEDVVYVVVTDWSSVESGIYAAQVTSVDYFFRNDVVELDGVLNIDHKGKEDKFGFSANEEKLESRHTYHNIFTNKEEAINFHNENLINKIKEMEQQVINLDSAQKIKPR